MRHKNIVLWVTLALLLAITPLAGVWAAPAAEDVPVCEGDHVSGTVVATDEATNTVTVDTGEGQCKVTMNDDTDHPIATLLGRYFGDVQPESLAAALEEVKGCAVPGTDGAAWAWSDCEAEGAVGVQVTGQNEDGTYTATQEDGTEINLTIEDEAEQSAVDEALDSLAADWDIDQDGDVYTASDDIAMYHDEGLGYGVLVKLYAIAEEQNADCPEEPAEGSEPCGVTVDQLIEEFQSGVGMGELYERYGKPSMTGVGHVRKNLNNTPTPPADEESEDSSATPAPEDQGNGNGNGNGNGGGNGNGNANGHDKDKDKGNNGNANGHDKDKGKGNNGNGGGPKPKKK